jgi:hypothetical protein
MRVSTPFSRFGIVSAALYLFLAGCDGKSTVAEPSNLAGHDHPGAGPVISGDLNVPGGTAVQVLGRAAFPDDINAMFRIKYGKATAVVNVDGPSDVMVARITVQPGGSFGWHTHHGPVIVTVASGALSIINASDCVHRTYLANNAFIDPGQGNVHVGFNDSAAETVVYATFLDVPAGQGPTIPADPACS